MIPVDYSLSTTAVFTNAVRVAFRFGTAWPLCAKTIEMYWLFTDPRATDLPSWCPDLGAKARSGEEALLRRPGSMVSEASVTRFKDNTRIDFESDSAIMLIRSIQLDTIVERSPFVFRWRADRLSKPLPAGWERTVETLTWLRGSDVRDWLDGLDHLFPSTSTGNAQDIWGPVYKPFRSSVAAPSHPELVRQLRDFRNAVHESGARTLVEAAERLQQPLSELEAAVRKLHGLLRGNIGRNFFRTAAGHAGFASARVEHGDRVCYFPGGRDLQIVSADGRRHITIAWVEHFMGDWLLNLPDRELAEKWVEFRLE